jgi:hypothetical protein
MLWTALAVACIRNLRPSQAESLTYLSPLAFVQPSGLQSGDGKSPARNEK